MPPISDVKKALRREAIKRRGSISREDKKKKDTHIKDRLMSLREYREANNIVLFASFRSEVNTFPIIEDALMKDKKVIMPKVDDQKKRLMLYSIRNVSELENGYMDIPEPSVEKDREMSPEYVDLVLMPGVAFDEAGGRLGYGGGYYDRLIGEMKERPSLIAVAYEEQIMSTIPVTEHDIRPDKIVTDTRIIDVKYN